MKTCDKLACGEESFAFERAYCFYRLNQFPEALKALGSSNDNEEGGRKDRLEAQIKYRMGDYAACAQMYERLYNDDPEDTGLLVNALASRISGDQPHKAIAAMAGKEEIFEASYELCFNLACAYIDEGRLEDAEAKLQDAKKICVAELLEGEEDEEEGDRRTEAELENHEELAAIQVQTATVLQRLGGEEALKKAGSLYNAVLKPRSSKEGEIDVTVKAVACNNLVALRPEGKSLFDSLKRLDIASKDSLEHKLTRKQAMEIAINKCLALLQARKLDAAKTELQKLTADFKGHPRVAVVQAAVAFKEKKAKGAEDVLQAYLTEHPGSEEALICLAQLHAQQNRYKDAAEALDQLPRASRANPRTAEVVVAFHQRQKNPDKAVTCLRDAISYWSGKDGGEEDEDMLAQVLRIASRLAIQLKDKAFAAEAFQLYLERVDGSDVEALCGLVQALASVDPQRATEYAQRLQVPDYAHLDPEELENGTIPKYAHMVKRGADGDAQKDQQAKKKKKRKPKHPKNYDPANPGPAPDPERWLPKRERTEFKKKMRKKDKNLARGPQGSMVVDEKALRKTGPSTAQVELSSDAASRPKGTKTKKGKK